MRRGKERQERFALASLVKQVDRCVVVPEYAISSVQGWEEQRKRDEGARALGRAYIVREREKNPGENRAGTEPGRGTRIREKKKSIHVFFLSPRLSPSSLRSLHVCFSVPLSALTSHIVGVDGRWREARGEGGRTGRVRWGLCTSSG